MKAMYQDYVQTARRHPLAFIGTHLVLFVVSFLLIDYFGYLIWRRFPLPVFILACSVITLLIARLFPTSRWFSGLFRSSGLLGIGSGLLMVIGGFVDAALWPQSGFFVSVTMIAFGYGVTFNVLRFYLHLKELSPEGRYRVEMNGDGIALEMMMAAAEAREYAEEIKQIAPTIMKDVVLR